MLDLKYKSEDVILVEKVGSDDYIAVLCNAQFLRDQGVEIPKWVNPSRKKRLTRKRSSQCWREQSRHFNWRLK
ncbi:MAG: hypothetical protein HN580_08885 [Deltaproteobacteria bacterium]|jgi:hypothetical protein|nr:hypothetical protein [Deltaproteobacteria bacterium]MBT4637665.1 hypothetical protein [Deltaproteobacteria bacterium]MBT6616545.1 hypothetical protein [Deltaproteobacteria bacterium]MBT7889124.1 hypothetical protein [Deltaproteobacteria bacterium]